MRDRGYNRAGTHDSFGTHCEQIGHSAMNYRSTVIIPTLGIRSKELKRAIASLSEQSSRDVVPLVVVNGDRFDRDLVQELRGNRDIRFHQIATPSVARARHEGRKQVDTQYFGFLDDDDEYLPDALQIKYRSFEANPDVEVVVGNGWHGADKRRLVWEDTAAIVANPADVLLDSNWLGSCAALFKTEAVGAEVFDFSFSYFEWTYLAMQLALTRRMSFVPEPTFIIHDTPGSVSKSESYFEACPAMLGHVLELEMPRPLRQKVRRKVLAAHHDLSEHYRRRGMMSAAWKSHLRSMADLHGLFRYGLFTRRLLAAPPARRQSE